MVTDDERHGPPVTCHFCRNALRETTTSTSGLSSPDTMTAAWESHPNTTCPACVRLYEGSHQWRASTPTPKAEVDTGKTMTSCDRATNAGLSLMASFWSRHHHLRRWLRPQRLISLDPSSDMSHSKLKVSTFASTYFIILVIVMSAASTDACSSRSTPKPRPPSQTSMRPNITFQTYACPPAYAAWYCLNGATCFTVKIADSILYNCECADGYMGQRCEFKDLDGSYLPARERLMMGQNSNVGHAFLVVLLIVMAAIMASVIFTLRRTRSKASKRRSTPHDVGYDDYGFGGNLTATTPVYPPYNTTSNSSGVNFVNNHHATGNGPATSPLGLSTFGHIQFRETAIGSSAFRPHHNDMSVVGQSISYTLSRQSVPRQFSEYSTDSYQANGVSRTLNRHTLQKSHHLQRMDQEVCFRNSDQFT